MNYRLVLKLIGSMLKLEAALMVFPLIASLVYGGDDKSAFLWAILLCAVIGISLSLLKPTDNTFKTKDAFAAAALAWIMFSFFGALPFYFSGYFNSMADCIFESVSGFTTTGATILTQVENLPNGILFWRSFSHWIGGMGVLVFMLAVMPNNASSINLLKAESTGLSPDRIVPKLRETARVLYLIYLAMTVLLIILLLFAGLPLFDTLIHAFSTAGTGGFSNMNASVGAYNNIAAEIIITIFMFLFGVSFALYYYLIKGNFKQVIKDDEFRFYGLFVAAAIIIITINLTGFYGSVSEALRHSSFQVSTIISTTGFATTDFNLWPLLSRGILVLLMLTGCCAGSTGGGIKLIRIVLLFKVSIVEIKKIVYPKSVKAVTINAKQIDSETITRTAIFFFIYIFVLIASSLIISVDGKDFVSTITAVISALGNIGPGLGIVGPVGNFSEFSSLSKIVLSFCMLAGRLEFFPILVLLNPSVWKKA